MEKRRTAGVLRPRNLGIGSRSNYDDSDHNDDGFIGKIKTEFNRMSLGMRIFVGCMILLVVIMLTKSLNSNNNNNNNNNGGGEEIIIRRTNFKGHHRGGAAASLEDSNLDDGSDNADSDEDSSGTGSGATEDSDANGAEDDDSSSNEMGDDENHQSGGGGGGSSGDTDENNGLSDFSNEDNNNNNNNDGFASQDEEDGGGFASSSSSSSSHSTNPGVMSEKDKAEIYSVRSYFENFGKRPVDIDREGSYKYVLILIEDSKGDTALLVQGCPHKDGLKCKHPDAYAIARGSLAKRGFKSRVLGGGRITRHKSKKASVAGYIAVFGYSKSFGACDDCNEKACKLIKAALPKYFVHWSNSGYKESDEVKIKDWVKCE